MRFFFPRLWKTVPPYSPDRLRTGRSRLGPQSYRHSQRDIHTIRGRLFPSSKLDYGAYSLRPFETKVPLGDTANPIAQQQTEPSPFQESRRYLGPVSLPASFSLPRARGEVPSHASRRNHVTFEPQSTMEELNKVAEFIRLQSPAPMRSLTPRWWPGFLGYSTFWRGLLSTTGVPACFIFVMLLVTAALDMIQMHLDDAIESDRSPINYVVTRAVFLARVRPHKSKLSPNKIRSEPREPISRATSFLLVVSVPTTIKSPPCLACLCPRTSNSSAVFSMVSVITSSPCLSWPGAYARVRPCSSHNRKSRLRSPCGTRSPNDP